MLPPRHNVPPDQEVTEMGQSLAAAAVSGTKSSEKQALLEAGDTEGLIALNHMQFGGVTMMAKDDDVDEDDEGETDEDEDDHESDTDEDEDVDEDDEDDKGEKKKEDPRDVKIKDLSAEAKKRRLRARQDRDRIANLEAENARLKKAKGKTKDKDDDAEDDEDDKSSKPDQALTERLRKQTIRTEFTDMVTASDSKIKFKDNKAAFRLLDLDDVDVTDEDEVEGLDDAIEALAEQYPWLLQEEDKQSGRRKTGQPTGRKKTTKVNDAALRKKYRV